jgi:hypothetical protein
MKASLLISITIALLKVRGQTARPSLVPFNEFVQSVQDANAREFMRRPTSKVTGPASFEEMRQHILGLYMGVQVDHSYILGTATFDCIPINQQPSVRILGLQKIAPPLTQPTRGKTSDEFGNAPACQEHTVPMRRITLDDLSRFSTLHDYLKKDPSFSAH